MSAERQAKARLEAELNRTSAGLRAVAPAGAVEKYATRRPLTSLTGRGLKMVFTTVRSELTSAIARFSLSTSSSPASGSSQPVRTTRSLSSTR